MKKSSKCARPPQKGKRQKAKTPTKPEPIFANAKLTDAGIIVSGASAARVAALGGILDDFFRDEKPWLKWRRQPTSPRKR